MAVRSTFGLDVDGKVAVVTGAGSGIGRGIAHALAAHGATVVLADIDEDAVSVVARELGALAVRTDVTEPESVDDLARAAVAEHGAVDILINNAGVGSMGRIRELKRADWRWMIDVNLYGVINGLTTFLPLLSERPDGAFIVNTSSMAGLVTAPGLSQASYVAAKMGVVGISEILGHEVAEDGLLIGVSVLCPGPVRSRISESLRTRPAADGPGALFDIDASATGPMSTMRWMDPLEVGELVVSAIQRGAPYIITHPELWPVVAERFDIIAEAFGVGADAANSGHPDPVRA